MVIAEVSLFIEVLTLEQERHKGTISCSYFAVNVKISFLNYYCCQRDELSSPSNRENATTLSACSLM
ncbi:hypothetical protein POREN0001_0123 [Porphyromonas endodontalis ATCC 35406]|uniref:Uncharacterized protein n=1 Tax=Porphyromonas endodontalis (strain ATCC 35406 / DSM 24491 / JCM 8526 / CCUG 16442 / BCRC 14492 / NCTC 13058 / HG 370) TaxID=553175 RepID=C3JCH8_POREA|nr:hypothetical protein POREN0001_0123 [Porphyromonas endodontalis ATCC 35406]